MHRHCDMRLQISGLHIGVRTVLTQRNRAGE